MHLESKGKGTNVPPSSLPSYNDFKGHLEKYLGTCFTIIKKNLISLGDICVPLSMGCYMKQEWVKMHYRNYCKKCCIMNNALSIANGYVI